MTSPIPGRPEEILAAADALDATAQRWRAIHGDVLARASGLGDAWHGSLAATTVVTRVRHDAEVAGRAGDACRAVSVPLRTFAEELRRAQDDWADGAGMAEPPDPADPTITDGTNVMESAVERALVANEEAARALRAVAAQLADLIPPETAPQVVGQDGDTFGQGLWDAGADAVGGIGAMLGGAADRLNPFSDRFGPAWASTAQMISSAVSDPLGAAESAVEDIVDPIVESYRHGGLDEASGRAIGTGAVMVGDRGVSALDKLGELGTASKLGHLSDPNPGWHSSVERGPRTPLIPGCGLQRHEDAGGHTLAPEKAHVGATDEEMLARQRASQGPIRVSSFYGREIAERAVGENLNANKDAISEWLQTTGRPKAFSFNHDFAVGRSAPANATLEQIVGTSRSTVVLKRSSSTPEGYYVLTSFPDP